MSLPKPELLARLQASDRALDARCFGVAVVLVFFIAAAMAALAIGAATLCAWLAANARSLRAECSRVALPASALFLLPGVSGLCHCLPEAARCTSMATSDIVVGILGLACFLIFSSAHRTAERWPVVCTTIGCALLLILAAHHLVGMTRDPALASHAEPALFVTANDAAVAPVLALLCITQITDDRRVLGVHAAMHGAFLSLVLVMAASRLVTVLAAATFLLLVGAAAAQSLRPRTAVAIGSAAILVLAVIGLSTNAPLVEKIRGGFDASFATRFYLSRAALRLWADAPLLGVGPGAFGAWVATQQELGLRPPGIDARFVPWPHSAPLEWLIEGGLLGVAGATGALLWLVQRSRSAGCGRWRLPLRSGAVVGVLGFILVAALEASIHRIYLLTGMGVALGALVQRDYGRGIRDRGEQ